MKITGHIITTAISCSALTMVIGACDGEAPSPHGTALFQSERDTETSAATTDADTEDPTAEPLAQSPWLVSIQRMDGEGLHWCAGAIIKDQWVLTAAHCVADKAAPTLKVVAGIERLGASGSDGIVRGVEQIVVHPSYAALRLGHEDDLALLWLDEPLDLSGPEVSAIEVGTLADLAPTASGVMAVVSGWGQLPSGDAVQDMEAIAVELLTNAEARATYGVPIAPDQLASKPVEGSRTCQADGGGPLVLEASQGPRLVGVASEGKGCDDASSPQVFARVSSYLEWIDSELSG